MQDLRYSCRLMRHDRAFTLIAVLILGLGIGANVAVFSVVNTILLRPLPFQNPRELVWIQGPPKTCGLSCVTYSLDAFESYQQRQRSPESVTAYMPFYGAADYKLTGSAARLRSLGSLQFLSDAGRAACVRRPLRTRRVPEERRACRAVELSVLEAAIRRRELHRGEGDHAEQHLDDRGRSASSDV